MAVWCGAGAVCSRDIVSTRNQQSELLNQLKVKQSPSSYRGCEYAPITVHNIHFLYTTLCHFKRLLITASITSTKKEISQETYVRTHRGQFMFPILDMLLLFWEHHDVSLLHYLFNVVDVTRPAFGNSSVTTPITLTTRTTLTCFGIIVSLK